ncbi:Intraflagellar transport protein 46 [Cichlidogyrus casuarinus]|uniref:Intraflagellar transport protein 46 homolog n=1 Tax=Cichlidogyrus casuarinus TaxID=1844966 RepID=A0ABD2QHX5_9PLAT
MSEWDPELELMLKSNKLPSADLECDLKEYVDIACALFDIPIYGNRIESLHLLFTLYMEFKSSQHFQQVNS